MSLWTGIKQGLNLPSLAPLLVRWGGEGGEALPSVWKLGSQAQEGGLSFSAAWGPQSGSRKTLGPGWQQSMRATGRQEQGPWVCSCPIWCWASLPEPLLLGDRLWEACATAHQSSPAGPVAWGCDIGLPKCPLSPQEPFYVRCIKPNEDKVAAKLDEGHCRHQVVYLGLLENVRVRRAGFASRQPYSRFLLRYGPCCPGLLPPCPLWALLLCGVPGVGRGPQKLLAMLRCQNT